MDLRGLHNGRGASNQVLAEAFGVSGNTVDYHIKQLFAHFDTRDRAQKVGKALRRI